jgi:hypothetical protein
MQKNIFVKFTNPLGIYNLDDFSYLYEDKELKRIAEKASLYFILQRPCLVFRNLKLTLKFIKGEIVQPFTGNYIEFELPLYQKDIIESDKTLKLELYFSYNKSLKEENNINDFVDCIIIKTPEQKNFTKLLTPDVILQRHYKKAWEVNIIGEINKLLEFDVKYIGHSVKQFISKRIKSHSNIQRILTTTQPLQKGMQISKELCVCLLEITDIHQVTTISSGDFLENEHLLKLPNNESIYYDAEKAFIHFFAKSSEIELENKDVYKSYPKGKNGLFDEKYENIIYAINDDIIFKYGNQQLNNKNAIYVDRKLKTVRKK